MEKRITFDSEELVRRVLGINDRNIPYLEALLGCELYVRSTEIVCLSDDTVTLTCHGYVNVRVQEHVRLLDRDAGVQVVAESYRQVPFGVLVGLQFQTLMDAQGFVQLFAVHWLCQNFIPAPRARAPRRKAVSMLEAVLSIDMRTVRHAPSNDLSSATSTAALSSCRPRLCSARSAPLSAARSIIASISAGVRSVKGISKNKDPAPFGLGSCASWQGRTGRQGKKFRGQ